ncbi:MAG: hypothetical protein GY880_24280 [Planctomycetaceae bacterium]|nr:hypothetical protein [Planctomycetaceae bacterium]
MMFKKLLIGLCVVAFAGCQSESREAKYMRLKDELAAAQSKHMSTSKKLRASMIAEKEDELLQSYRNRGIDPVDEVLASDKISEAEKEEMKGLWMLQEWSNQSREGKFPELNELRQKMENLRREIEAMEKT